MAEISLNIPDLFEQQFGYKSLAFSFPDVPAQNKTGKKGTDLVDNDAFGREFFMPVWLGKDVNSFIALPYPVIRIESKKTLVQTALTERNGTVKELINIQDYSITIRGLMVSTDGQWPEDQIDQLHSLFLVQDSLIIKSALTDIFLITPERGGHDKVVITDMRFPESKGGINVRAYEISLVSDAEFSLYEI